MSHIGKRAEIPSDELAEIQRLMLTAVTGKPISLVAQAGLDICLGLWARSGDVTRDMALRVVTSQIDNAFKQRSN